MTSELYRDITKKTLPAAAALLVLTIALALSLACGAGGGASPECLDTLYLGPTEEQAREQLSQPVTSMDHEARLATIKALTYNGNYARNATSAECGDFVNELQQWENTDEGQRWHSDSGEDIATAISSFPWGDWHCKKVLEYDRLMKKNEDFVGKLKVIERDFHWNKTDFHKKKDYIYNGVRTLRIDETITDEIGYFADYSLECLVTADVNNQTRQVTNIRAIEGVFTYDDFELNTFPRNQPALKTPPQERPTPIASQPADVETTATPQSQTLTPVPTPTIHLYARLEPDPSTVTFTAEHGLFKTFTVRTSYPNGVRLVLDPDRTLYGIPKLDFGVGDSPPTHSGCPSDTRHTRQLNEGSKIHLEACTYGTTTIQLIPWHREVTKLDAIETYTISIPEPEPTRTPTPEPPDA